MLSLPHRPPSGEDEHILANSCSLLLQLAAFDLVGTKAMEIPEPDRDESLSLTLSLAGYSKCPTGQNKPEMLD